MTEPPYDEGFPARYDGVCHDCESPIKVGQAIESVDSPGGRHRLYRHVTCPYEPKVIGVKCARCKLIHPGEC